MSVAREALTALLVQRARTQSRIEPASHGQRALYYLHQTAPHSAAYHVAFATRVRSHIDHAGMQHALQSVVNRHAALRTGFELSAGELVQRIHEQRSVALERIDATGWTDEQLHERVAAAHEAPFDLARDTLLRARLFTRDDTDHVLLLTIHHIVHDAWSLWILIDELQAAYLGRSALPPAHTYADHVRWEADLLAGARGDALWRYWQGQLEGAPQVLDLPADRPRAPTPEHEGASVAFELPAALSSQLKSLARAEGATPYMLLLAAYQVLLFRCSGQDDVLVASPSACRGRPEAAGLIGYLANPLVMRARLGGNPSFLSVLRQVRQTVLDALAHEEFPFPLLVHRLQPRREAAHAPLVQVAFALQKLQRADAITALCVPGDMERRVHWAGLELQAFDMAQQEGQYELELSMIEAEGSFHGRFKYNAAQFDRQRIQGMAQCFVSLLSDAMQRPDTPVERLALLSEEDRARVLALHGPLPQTYGVSCLHHAFEAQAARRPHAVALRAHGRSMSYGELNERASALAQRLLKRGVGPESVVGLCIDRSAEMIVGILGILKASAAYLPLDPDSPPQRLGHIVADSRAALVVTRRALADKLPDTPATLLLIDDDEAVAPQPVPEVTPEHLAYVIYTSGSTGQPKGVQLTHANAARLFSSSAPWYRFSESDVWSVFHSVAFDVSVWEIFGALMHGGCAVVVPHEVTRAPDDFLRLLSEERVTILSQTPSAFRLLLQAEARRPDTQPLHLRLVVFAGEQLDPPLLAPWIERHGDDVPQLVNMYGITETAVHCTYRRMTLADVDSGRSIIGVPLPDTGIYLLDRHGEPVPQGMVGEIYVSGPSVARGYLHKPELTQQRFGPDPFNAVPGTRMYRSGDLARCLPSGELEYLGRIDKQVKLRGFRIELGEIEAVIAQHEQVREAVVVLRHDGADKRLVAYAVPAQGHGVSLDNLRRYVAERLPAYMVPAAFVEIAQLPLTHNGKLDERALPAPDTDRSAAHGTPPRNAVEQRLQTVWQAALEVQPVGVHDNFFELGGHSLMAVSLMLDIEHAFGRRLPVSTLFQCPTIAQMAALLQADVPAGAWSPLVAIQPAGTRPPLFAVPGGGGNVLCFEPLARHLGNEQPFYGLQARGLDGTSSPFDSVEEMAQCHLEALRGAQPHGPYRLAGHCFGGLVAFEMARRLEQQGEQVALLALMDCPAPPQTGSAPAPELDDAAWLLRIAQGVEEASGRSLGLDLAGWERLDAAVRLRELVIGLRRVGFLPPHAGEREVQALVEASRVHERAQSLYRATTGVNAPTLLLRAGEPHASYDFEAPLLSAQRPSLGWKRLARTTLMVQRVPGHHLSMLAEPHAKALAARLREWLA